MFKCHSLYLTDLQEAEHGPHISPHGVCYVRFGVRTKRKNKLDLYSKALPQIQDLGTHGRAKVKRNHGKSNRIYPPQAKPSKPS